MPLLFFDELAFAEPDFEEPDFAGLFFAAVVLLRVFAELFAADLVVTEDFFPDGEELLREELVLAGLFDRVIFFGATATLRELVSGSGSVTRGISVESGGSRGMTTVPSGPGASEEMAPRARVLNEAHPCNRSAATARTAKAARLEKWNMEGDS